MSIRLISRLSGSPSTPKVKHYLGLPPGLTGAEDSRQEMGPAVILLIEEKPSRVFLYRFGAQGECVGDTWHSSAEEAMSQASYEYGQRAQRWEDVPQDVADAVVLGLNLANERGPRAAEPGEAGTQ